MKKRSLLIALLSMVMVLMPALCAFADTETGGEPQQEAVTVSADDEDLPAAVEEPEDKAEAVNEEPAEAASNTKAAMRAALSGWVQDEYGEWVYYDPSTGEMWKGWLKSGNYWYYLDDEEGYMWADTWGEIDGKNYYFDAKGKMKTGWLKEEWTDEEDGETYVTWYYFNSSGAQVFGWQKISGKWYYFDEEDDSGYMYSDTWMDYNGNTYYFDASGAMKTGWLKEAWSDEEGYSGVEWFYFNSSGAQVFGWQKISNKWYYFDPDEYGCMTTDWLEINGKWYYFDASGAMKTGWVKETYSWDGETYTDWYYLNSSGVQVFGWQKISGKWYYFPEYSDGAMATGVEYDIDKGKYYLFGDNGVWQSGFTGWKKFTWTDYDEDEGETTYTDWFYFKKGTGVDGWQKISNNWYYFFGGYMAANEWASDSKGWYYMGSDGKMIKNQTLVIGDQEYTFGSDGICLNPPEN